MDLKKAVSGILAATIVAGTGTCALPSVSAATEASSVPTVSIDPTVQYQTLEGWGTSLAWFANIIGGWTEDYNGNGTPDREDIAELIFSPEYLNMNIVRYNIGGGDDPTHDHIKRCEATIPGWKTSADAELDPTADANQIWFLEQANEWRDDVINEVFSNTPPYYMTNSGCASGAINANDNNLRDDQYEEFAQYLAEVTQWLDNHLYENYGNHINYIEPINEPDTNYWAAYSTKQEGCHFDSGADQSRIYRETLNALELLNLDYIQITGTDETSVDHAINSFNKLESDVKQAMPVISTHTYGSSNRQVLSDLAASYDKGLWMSEVCYGGSPHDPDSMNANVAFTFANSIQEDLKTLQSTAWVDWQVVDSEYEVLKWDQNWGLIHAVYESNDQPVPGYHDNLLDENGQKLDWVPGTGEWHATKQFYTLMQYSKYLKAGYTIIDIQDSNMVAAVSPDGDELVIVANNSGTAQQEYLDLRAFPGAAKAEVYRTSDSESCELVDTLAVSSNVLPVELAQGSVTTFVITAENGASLYDANNGTVKRVNSSVVTNDDTVSLGATTNNKFEYSGTWSRYTSQSGAYKADVQGTTTPGASVTFRFDGDRAVITGNTEATGGKLTYSIDGGEAVELDTYSETKLYGQVLVDTGYLPEGSHTVTITMTQGSTGGAGTPIITVDEAQVYYGQAADYSLTPLVPSVSAFDGSILVAFNPVDGAENYTLRYGSTDDPQQWTESITTETSPVAIKGLENGVPCYFTLQANVPGETTAPTAVFTATPEATENTGVYYFVDSGVANPYDTHATSSGMYSSNLEQPYGEDPVTGKLWGYDASVAGGTSTALDPWDSVRYDDQNTVGKGILYTFELEPGEYTVEVGLYDPWQNGGRYQDVLVQGEAVATRQMGMTRNQIVAKGVVAEGEDSMTVEIVRSAGVTDQYQDPVVSYVKISTYDPDAIASINAPNAIISPAGQLPDMPEQVTVTTLSGGERLANVTWEMSLDQFMTPYSVVMVTGTVEGIENKLTAKVTVMPEMPLYFVDSGFREGETSDLHDLVSSAYPELLNRDTPDQAYTQGGWGYIASDVGAYYNESGNAYNNGWYAYSGKDITYKFQLSAGTYELNAGFHEWWNVARNIDVSVDYVDAEGNPQTTLVLDNIFINGSSYQDIMGTGTFTLPVDCEVSIRVHKAPGESNDPVISWLAISCREGALKELRELISQASILEEKGYTSESWAALQEALEAAKAAAAGTDSAAMSNAYTTLENAVNGLTADKTSLEALIAQCGEYNETDYTPASWAVLQDALAQANTVMENTSATVEEVTNALNTLTQAKDGLIPVSDFSKLEKAIADAEAMDTQGYTAESVAALQQAIIDAKTVAADKNSTQEQIEQQITALENAVNALVVDKASLEALIAQCGEYNENDYTPASWAVLKDALAQANTVMDNASATVEEVTNAMNTLTQAKDGLIPVSDFSQLEKAIIDAEAVDTQGYTAESVAALQQAIIDAKAVAADKNSTQEQIEQQIAALENAVNGLVVDKASLEALIAQCGELNENDYTPASWAVLTDALAQANTVMENASATVEEVTNALNALTQAKDALTAVADFSKLEKAITDAEAVDTQGYTAESVAALQQAIINAKTVAANKNSTQEQVDQQIAALENAVNGLVVDKASLEALIAQCGEYNEEGYTPASWTVLQNALAQANTVMDNASATVEEVANAMNTLTQAKDGLTPVSDFSQLEKAIIDAEAVDTQGYTAESVAALQKAIADAKAVAADKNSTQEQIEQQITALENAVNGLAVDKSSLEALIAQCGEYTEEGYTPASWAVLQNALAQANTVMENASATVEEVANALNTLTQAKDGLTPVSDFSQLEKAIIDAEAVDTQGYTAESVAALQKAIADAKAVAADKNSTQEQIAQQIAALENAINGLKKPEPEGIIYDLDDGITVDGEGAFPNRTIVKIEKILSGTIFEEAVAALKDLTEEGKLAVFEVTAMLDGQEIQPDTPVKVTFTLPENLSAENLKMAYIADDGTLEEIAITVDAENGIVTAELEHFSTYALFNEAEDDNTGDNDNDGDNTGDNKEDAPQTGDEDMRLVCLLALASACAFGVMASGAAGWSIRRKKAQQKRR